MHTIKLFCIPYAGGSATIYSNWKRKLQKNIELILLEPAGRGRRSGEPLYNDLNEAVDDLYREVASVMEKDENYILFGHSMGSLLAFELYYKLIKEGFREPIHLYVSGGKAPHLERDIIYHDKPLEQFKKRIMDYDGVQSALLFQSEELLHFFLPVLRSDFKIVETYHYTTKTNKIGCDMTALTGIADSSLTLNDVAEWIRHAGENFYIKQYEGGHFFINDYKEQIIEMIHEMVQGMQSAETYN
ncbi:thioesterase II family protein [Paenibacillus xylanexedens]|uniref:thioesterase II family protein n=1 Tax=Paenibacillus xylanexedens TaxID=528191 RepID=UPI00119FF8BF|nr:thioesterase domain-containing protein [Paenibacillus xylanexedens]